MNKTGANFSFGSEAKLCNHLLSAGRLGLGRMHVGVTPICNVRVRATERRTHNSEGRTA